MTPPAQLPETHGVNSCIPFGEIGRQARPGSRAPGPPTSASQPEFLGLKPCDKA